MTTSRSFSAAPYFDDFKSASNFLKVLFQPGRPVQTRELNQLQSILQNQINGVSDHLFKNGAMVIPGNIFYDNNIVSLKIEEVNGGIGGISSAVVVPGLVGKTIKNDAGTSALVVHYSLSNGEANSFTTLFVKYLSSSTDGLVSTFPNLGLVYDVDNISIKLQLTANASNFGSIVTVNDGIYYINGNYVSLAKQTIVLDANSIRPTYRVGLKVVENIITEADDESLFDNALGYSNFAAPGAHRYQVNLILEKRGFDYNDAENSSTELFVDLIHIKSGEIVLKINSTEYSEIERIFARRTYDESGNYEVDPFNVVATNYRSNNRGVWAIGVVYLLGDIVLYDGLYWEARTSGVSGSTVLAKANITQSDGNVSWVQVNKPFFNNGVFSPLNSESLRAQTANDNLLSINISKGKAYILGSEVEKQIETQVSVIKALDAEYAKGEIIPVTVGSWVQVKDIQGIPNIDSCELVSVYPHIIGGFVGTAATATYTVNAGAINGITITAPGTGYTIQNPPTITAPVGTGAIFRPVISAAGEITSIKILSGGSGYTAGSLTVSVPTEAPIGECRIRSMEYNSGVIGGNAVYTLQIFDLRMNLGYDASVHAKSLQSTGVSGWLGNVVTRLESIDGYSTYFSASKIVLGTNTAYNNLTVGQALNISGVTYVVSSIVSNTSLLLKTNAAVSGSGSIFAELGNFRTSGGLIQFLPKKYIKTVKSETAATLTTYDVKRRFKDVAVSGNSLTLSLTASGESFTANTIGYYIVANQANKTIVTQTSVVATGQSVTISGLSIASGTVEVLATITKTSSAAKEKIKTLSTKTVDITNVSSLGAKFISLTEADIYRLIKVYKVDGAGVAVSGNYPVVGSQTLVDITDDFKFEDGQTPFAYEVGTLVRNNGIVTPNNTIRIIFEYFEHSVGDYFSVDSYVNLPFYKIDSSLRDCLDFRPRIADNNTDYLISGGASVSEPILENSYFICDYGYYLPRKDLVSINQSGNFSIALGVSGYSLKVPATKSDLMSIAEVTLLPGALDINDKTAKIVRSDNKRFTMRDISVLEKRINNLEYYTQLSLLEKQSLTEDIVDQNGMTRFKSGILVDDFKNQDIADGTHDDYLISTDVEIGECRAFAEADALELREENLSDTQRKSSGYQLTGSLITLPYTDVEIISQPLASRTELVNPFAVVVFNGSVTISPTSDSWVETALQSSLTPQQSIAISQMAVTQQTGNVNLIWNFWQLGGERRGQAANRSVSINGEVEQGSIGINIAPNRLNNNWIQSQLGRSATTEVVTLFSPSTVLADRRTDDVLVGTQVIPYARTIPISFKLERSRPSSIYSASIGGLNVINNLDMATDISVNLFNGTGLTNVPLGFEFKDNTNFVIDSALRVARTVTVAKLRQYSNMPVVQEYIWDRGEVIVQYVTGNSGAISASAVVLDIVNRDITGTVNRVIKAINVIGTFSLTKNIFVLRNSLPVLSVSAVNITSVNTPTAKVITDSVGVAYGVFYPPCTDSVKLPSGDLIFRLENGDGTASDSSFAETIFTSNGSRDIINRAPPPPPPPPPQQVQQPPADVNNTAGGELGRRNFGDPSSEFFFGFDVEGGGTGGWNLDPLAQTFVLDERNSTTGRVSTNSNTAGQGAFITSVGLYFAVKDNNLPVTVQLRGVSNGYPNSTIFATKTVQPYEIITSTDSSTETIVRFSEPVFLKNLTEYCVVILSNSVLYEVWVARVGDNVAGNNSQIISEQPSLGVLFKSQNNSTWTAEQLEDLKFKLYRAKFDTSGVGTVDFVNRSLTRISLKPNALFAVNGSSDIRVTHNKHGFNNGDKVTIGTYTNGPFSTGLNLINATVSNVTYDNYTLVGVGLAAATYTGYFGGSSIIADTNLQFSSVLPSINSETFNGTGLGLTMEPMTENYTYNTPFQFLNNEVQHFSSMMKIASYANEQLFIADTKKKSFKMTAKLLSTDDFYSPVVNADHTSMILIRNKLNNPGVTLNNSFDEIVLGDSLLVTYDINTININESYLEVTGAAFTATQEKFDALSIGKFISVRIPATGTASVNINKTFLITDIVKVAATSYRVYVNGTGMVDESIITGKTSKLVLLDRYVDEIAPNGTSVFSTYVAKRMDLNIPATSIRVTLDVNKPSGTFVDVYYRSTLNNEYVKFDDRTWKIIPPERVIADMKDFQTFVEVKFEIRNLPAFDVCQIKVVFRADNIALTPRIKNMRVIALS